MVLSDVAGQRLKSLDLIRMKLNDDDTSNFRTLFPFTITAASYVKRFTLTLSLHRTKRPLHYSVHVRLVSGNSYVNVR